MKKSVILSATVFMLSVPAAQSQLKAPGVKWDDTYEFDRSNAFRIEFYAKNNELMRSLDYKTFYRTNGDNFSVKLITAGKGNGMETVIDKKNEVAIQIFGQGGTTEPFYNAGGFRYPDQDELKKLEIIPTQETREILGYACKRYTYTYKKIFGEVWLTDQITMSNDLGLFRAAKMAALHNSLSVGGFVMEMTTEDAKGGKTLMKTVSLGNNESYSVDLKAVKMNTAINKVNYFTF